MKTPKISIIVPVYNMENSLSSCIKNIQHQTINEIEILCYNDGSTDASLSILQELASSDSRIKILSGKNQGPGNARNECMKIASAEYISFMDADDEYYSTDSLERLYVAAKEKKVNLCGGAICLIQNDSQMRTNKSTHLIEGYFTPIQYQYNFGYQSFIFSRELLISNHIFFPEFLRYQDPPFFLKAQLASKLLYRLPFYTYKYSSNDKPINYWDFKRVTDFISGITEDIKISCENNLINLALSKLARINLISSEQIVTSYLNGNKKILSLLEDLNLYIHSNINIKNYLSNDSCHLLPLIEIKKIHSIENQQYQKANSYRKSYKRVQNACIKYARISEPEMHYYRSRYINLLKESSDIDNARKEINLLISDFPDDHLGWRELSFLEESEKNLTKSISAAKKSIDANPNMQILNERLCHLLRSNDQDQAALIKIKEIIQKNPKLAWPWRVLSLLEFDRGHNQHSLDYARKCVAKKKNDINSLLWLVDLLLLNNNFSEAKNILNDILEKQPNNIRSLTKMIKLLEREVYYRELKNFDEIIPYLKKLMIIQSPYEIRPKVNNFLKRQYRKRLKKTYQQSRYLGLNKIMQNWYFIRYGLPAYFRKKYLIYRISH